MANNYYRNVIENAQKKIARGETEVPHVPYTPKIKTTPKSVQTTNRNISNNQDITAEETPSAVSDYEEIKKKETKSDPYKEIVDNAVNDMNSLYDSKIKESKQRVAQYQDDIDAMMMTYNPYALESESPKKTDKEIRAMTPEQRKEYGATLLSNLQNNSQQRNTYNQQNDLYTLINREKQFQKETRQEKKDFEKQAKIEKYSAYQSNPDFISKSNYQSTANGKESSYIPSTEGNVVYTQYGYDNPKYEIINKNKDVLDKWVASNANSPYGIPMTELSKMTDDEVRTYNYIYNTQGEDKADEYIKDISEDLTARQNADYRKFIEDETDKNLWSQIGMSAASTLVSPLRMGSSSQLLGNALAGQNIDPNDSAYSQLRNYTYARNKVANNIRDLTDYKALNESLAFMYNVGMGMLDSALNRQMFGGFTTMVNGELVNRLSVGAMAGDSFGSAALKALDEGKTQTQAAALGLFAGLASYWSENANFKALYNRGDKTWLQHLLNNMVEEGKEEGFEDVVNDIADLLIMQDENQWRKAIDGYVSEGYSPEDAFGMAVMDKAKDIGLDVLGGAISGGVMAGANMAYNSGLNSYFNATNQNVNPNIEQNINNASEINGNLENAQEIKGNENFNNESGIDIPSELELKNQQEISRENPVNPIEEITQELVDNGEIKSNEEYVAEREESNVTSPSFTQEIRNTEAEGTIENPVEVVKTNISEEAPANREFVRQIKKSTGVNVAFADYNVDVNGEYDGNTNTITFNRNATQGDVIYGIAAHELTHYMESSPYYNEYADLVTGMFFDNQNDIDTALQNIKNDYFERVGQNLTDEQAMSELVASCSQTVFDEEAETVQRIVKGHKGLATHIKDFLTKIKSWISKTFNLASGGGDASRIKKIDTIADAFEKALNTAAPTERDVQYDVNASDDLKARWLAKANADEQNPAEIENVKEALANLDDDPVYSPPFSDDDVKMAQSLYKLGSTGKILEGFSLYNQTPDRVMEMFANGDEKKLNFLKSNTTDILYDHTAEYSKAVTKAKMSLLNDIVKKFDIKPKSVESAAIMWIGSGEKIVGEDANGRPITESYTLDNLKEDFPNTWENIVSAERWFRKTYDNYIEDINDVRRKIYPNDEKNAQHELELAKAQLEEMEYQLNETQKFVERTSHATDHSQILQTAQEKYKKAYDRYDNAVKNLESSKKKHLLQYRKDYFHHFQEMSSDNTIPSIVQAAKTSIDIDPNLVGISAFTKPKSKWQGIFQKQGKGAYVEDAVSGLLRYIDQAEYAIHVDPVIANWRGFTSELVKATSDTRNANALIQWMTDYTNVLAGKTNPLDRFLQTERIRPAFQAMKKLNNLQKSNRIVGNLSSAIAQWSNLPNAKLYIQDVNTWRKGYSDYIKSYFDTETKSNLLESDFMRLRYLDDLNNMFDDGKFSVLKKAEDAAAWMMSVGDKEAAKIIWFTAYEDGLKKGVDNPIRHADDITRKSVAGRGIGELPIAQQSELVKLVAPFQVEVSNAWYAKNKAIKDKDWKALLSFWISSWLMNKIDEKVRGSKVSFDPLGTAVETVTGWFDDDDEDANWVSRVSELVMAELGEEISNAPFGSWVAEILSSGDDDTLDKMFGDNNPGRYGTGLLGVQAIAKPLFNVIKELKKGKSADWGTLAENTALTGLENFSSWGGTQMRRSIQTLESLGVWNKIASDLGLVERKMPGSYSASGRLRFVMDDNPLNIAKGIAFGQYATEEGKEYLDNGSKTLSDKQTALAQKVWDMGVEPTEAFDFAKGFKSGQSDYQVAEYILDAFDDMTSEQMSDIYEWYKGDKYKEKSDPFLAMDDMRTMDDNQMMEIYSAFYSGEKKTQDALETYLNKRTDLTKTQRKEAWSTIGGMNGWNENNNPYK